MRPGPRRAARKDANHNALVQRWRAHGGTWLDTYQLPGALDGVAGAHGIDVRCEIKDASKPPSKRAVTDAESETMQAWEGRPPIVWETVDDVDRTYQQFAAEKLRRVFAPRMATPRRALESGRETVAELRRNAQAIVELLRSLESDIEATTQYAERRAAFEAGTAGAGLGPDPGGQR